MKYVFIIIEMIRESYLIILLINYPSSGSDDKKRYVLDINEHHFVVFY